MPNRAATTPKLLPHELRQLARRSAPRVTNITTNNVVSLRKEPPKMPSAKSPDKPTRRPSTSKSASVEMEIYTNHTKTVRYRALEQDGVIRDAYIDRASMPDGTRPPKRIRVSVDFL